MKRDTRQLTRANHRLAGTEEGKAAAKYILQRLKDLGIEAFKVPFPTAQTEVKQCELRSNEKVLPLIPMRPNGLIPPSTPAGGVTGKLIDAGKGQPADFKESPEGKIVVLDYNSGAGWRRAFRLGAKAVIFVSSGTPDGSQRHSLQAHANLLRFYYQGDRQNLPIDQEATLFSTGTWERTEGTNLVAYIPGTDPVFDLQQPEAVIVSAPLDSFGEAPRFAPGARVAANASALLAIAEYLVAHPVKRNTVLVFFDQDARGHQGASRFFLTLAGILEGRNSDFYVSKLQKSFRKEQEFIEKLGKALSLPIPWATDSAARRDVEKIVRLKAENEAGSIREKMGDVRRERYTARRENDTQAIAAFDTELSKLQEAMNGWNDFRRNLDAGLAEGTDNETKIILTE